MPAVDLASESRPTEYQQHVLNIRAPVSVVLAKKKIPLGVLLDLVPGSMIQFEQNCEAPLVLEVGGVPLAVGEAVKVDDKFGLRIRDFDVASED